MQPNKYHFIISCVWSLRKFEESKTRREGGVCEVTEATKQCWQHSGCGPTWRTYRTLITSLRQILLIKICHFYLGCHWATNLISDQSATERLFATQPNLYTARATHTYSHGDVQKPNDAKLLPSHSSVVVISNSYRSYRKSHRFHHGGLFILKLVDTIISNE